MSSCPKCGEDFNREHMCIGMLEGMPVGERVGRRIVAIGAVEKARAAEIMAYADAHPYRPESMHPPGLNPNHTMRVPFGVRAVFSLSILGGRRYRHLSISLTDVGREERAPSPEVTFMIAIELFRFKGPPKNWQIGFPPDEPGVVVVAHCLDPADA